MKQFSRQSSEKNLQIPNFIKIRPVGSQLSQTDGHNKANGRFSQFSNAPKNPWHAKYKAKHN
jgi:hypothetical protein